ncbi:hypothetical protein GN244_ATG13888 [Phytophthora infestans]|uniref:Uncharacterized protein n=1 Tax=Phytophthora infestans TaxID=4787 RepID=A0A833VYK2_PHYIN|nr:hypothetical protein GN244_ATG13888 [Phytophthora infestans]KAF4137656.1 hypothetical protein GN958_ATG13168 [Phytophthora infestans]
MKRNHRISSELSDRRSATRLLKRRVASVSVKATPRNTTTSGPLDKTPWCKTYRDSNHENREDGHSQQSLEPAAAEPVEEHGWEDHE